MSTYNCRGAINGIIVQNNPVNFIDPDGLDWLDASANFAAGFGDQITSGFGLSNLFGLPSLTEYAREQMGTDKYVDKCSGFYKGGEIAGDVWGVALGGAGASALNKGIVINGTRVLQVHKHKLSMKILKNAGYSRKVAGALRNKPLWHVNWGRKGHFIFRRLLGK